MTFSASDAARALRSITYRRIAGRVVPRPDLQLETIGSRYGGWIVPMALIRPDWVCYCGGVGEDITFDLGLIERLGCTVFAFDPTPRAVAHVASHAAAERRFHFMPVGLWSKDATLKFFAPRDPTHVSHSVLNLQETDAYFEAPCRSLPSLMAELGHRRIDLLKIDIEGAEHAVVRSMLKHGIRPTVLCLEIDQPVPPLRFGTTVARVLAAGYELVAVDHWNFTFVHRTAAAQPVARVEAPRPSPRVTFGVIVLNGEPFTRYTLRALYPFAHEIIVAEGAAPGARNVATPDGHSRDGTLEALRRFKAEEDPENKLTIVTAEDEGHADGFWPGEKDEQSRAYARRATGDYLWQVDIDELYHHVDMKRVLAMLRADPGITAMSFKQITFWGGLGYRTDGWYLRRGATYYHRLFAWGPGYTYASHRPPTVLDEKGRDTRDIRWIDAPSMAARGIFLHHYSLLLPKQVIEKCDYYANAPWARRSGAIRWAEEAFLSLRRPFRVHNVDAFPSWLERHDGPHPEQVAQMVEDLRRGDGDIPLRETADIERLLTSPWYRAGRFVVRRFDRIDRLAGRGLRRLAELAAAFQRRTS